MLYNIVVAILTNVNDLAARHGLRPYDFVAVLRTEEYRIGVTKYVLDYETPASGNALREERFDKMLKHLGISKGDDVVLSGSCQHIIDSFDNALELAPRPKGRL
jgi:hypothetical protein